MSSTNGAIPALDSPPEAPPKPPPPPTLTENQWLAITEAAAAVKAAEEAMDRAQTQWRLVCAATGIEGAWTLNPGSRTIVPA